MTSPRLPIVPRYGADLIPATAYWRELTAAEEKVDWAQVEHEDGADLQISRYLVGIILTRSMERYIEWTRTLTPGRKADAPLYHEAELTQVFLHLETLAWFRGSMDVRQQVARFYGTEVEAPRSELSAMGVEILRSRARRTATALARHVRDSVTRAWADAWTENGERRKTQEQVEGEIRTVFASSFVEPGPKLNPLGSDVLQELAASPSRRMKVRDRRAYEEWRRSRIPFAKWIKQSVEQIRAEGLAGPQVPARFAKGWLQTERTRYRVAGAHEEARRDDRIGWLQFSSLRDGNVCKVCRRRDGVVRKKEDNYWAFNSPPMHFECRCFLVVVLRGEGRVYVTPIRELPDEIDVANGFGTYDPRKVLTAKRLGLAVKP